MSLLALLAFLILAIAPARAAEPIAVNIGITNVIADVPLFVAD